MAEPLVSVVIPTHRRFQVLTERSLPSVLNQTHQNLDIHVVSDGHSAGVEEFIDDLNDSRIRYTELPRQDLPLSPPEAWCVLGLEARNFGHEQAMGGYIVGLDDDDELLPSMIETLLKHLWAADADVAYGRSKAFRADGGIDWYGNWPPQHFAFCEGAWLSKHDMGFRYDPECISRGLPEDGDRIDRMVAAGVRFTFVDEIVHYYYPNPR